MFQTKFLFPLLVAFCAMASTAHAVAIKKLEVLDGFARGIDENGSVLLTRVTDRAVQDWTWSESAGYALVASRDYAPGQKPAPSSGTAQSTSWFAPVVEGAAIASILCTSRATSPCLFSVNVSDNVLVRQGRSWYAVPCFGYSSCGEQEVAFDTTQIWSPFVGGEGWANLSDYAPLLQKVYPGPIVVAGQEFPNGYTLNYPSSTYAVGINSSAQMVLRSESQLRSYYVAASVPEPSSVVTMMAGCLLLGGRAFLRNRRRS